MSPGRFLLLAALGLGLLVGVQALAGCAASVSWSLARANAATGTPTTCAASDHWSPAAVRAAGEAVGAGVGEAARRAKGLP